MKVKFTISFFLFLYSLSYSQNYQVSKIEETNPIYPNQFYIFPLIIGGIDSVTSKINSDIIFSYLDIEKGEESVSIFENVWSTEQNSIPQKTDLNFKVNEIDSLIYSVSISGQGCGAYCEYFTTSFNYNLINGDPILLDSLLSPSGKQKVLNFISNQKRVKILNQLYKIDSILLDSTLIDEDFEYYKDMKYMFEDCLPYAVIESFEYLDFFINKNFIVIVNNRCSPHVIRALDELGDFVFQLDKKEWSNDLSEYGKMLLIKN